MLAIVQESELDRGATSVAPGTQRTCALGRELKPVDEMIRFVVGPAGEVVPDVKRKLPGRGLWITATRNALETAVKRNVFGRGFRRAVKTAPDLVAQTDRLLERAALDALAMAGKGGALVTGFAKVEDALARSDLMAVIHARDGAADGRRKLDGALHRSNEERTREIVVIDAFSGEQLDLALNRPNVVHAALLAGPGSETFLARVTRLMRFRTGQSPEATNAHVPNNGARGHSTE
ncbi:MAG TPA: RNA-binding protein [Pseudolabrys sp.]|nr:RNA-binding protein [Pseudolabrys sp.]